MSLLYLSLFLSLWYIPAYMEPFSLDKKKKAGRKRKIAGTELSPEYRLRFMRKYAAHLLTEREETIRRNALKVSVTDRN